MPFLVARGLGQHGISGDDLVDYGRKPRQPALAKRSHLDVVSLEPGRVAFEYSVPCSTQENVGPDMGQFMRLILEGLIQLERGDVVECNAEGVIHVAACRAPKKHRPRLHLLGVARQKLACRQSIGMPGRPNDCFQRGVLTALPKLVGGIQKVEFLPLQIVEG